MNEKKIRERIINVINERKKGRGGGRKKLRLENKKGKDRKREENKRKTIINKRRKGIGRERK